MSRASTSQCSMIDWQTTIAIKLKRLAGSRLVHLIQSISVLTSCGGLWFFSCFVFESRPTGGQAVTPRLREASFRWVQRLFGRLLTWMLHLRERGSPSRICIKKPTSDQYICERFKQTTVGTLRSTAQSGRSKLCLSDEESR